MATTVTAAHPFISRHLYASIQGAQTPASKPRFVTPDKESSMNTLWQEEECERICSRESLTEKATEIEKTISVKEHAREHHNFDPTMFYENRFGIRRPDGIVINKNHWTLYILEFKRSSDRNKDFLGVKEDEANEQHKSITEALKAAAPEWTFEQINFVAGRRCAVVEDDSKTSSKGSVYKQERITRFWRRKCNAYVKRMAQLCDPTINKCMGHLGLTRRRR